ncbi:unnamed protein product [Allacma fusca]|uniref:EB domain-containing protein n=1 Tax=Allacma fusca TaxID=39272 RepID=A0A8J2K5A8_9HEXA|nr:unnamed protein product [Allacma fusca]
MYKIGLAILVWLYLQPMAVSKVANFSRKGEKCGSDSKGLCDPAVNLECSQGVCDCKSGYTISRNGTKCLEIARNGLESPCEESIQCWKSLLGRLSECNIATNKCSCYESETLPIVFHQGRCYYGEILGENCQIDGLCSMTTINAICKMGLCQCKDGYVPSWDKSRCLPIATQGLNSACEENIQCEKSPLGTLSECNQDRMQCECYQIPMVPTVFHQGRCYFGAGLGDLCQVVSQCTSKVRNSVCGKDGKCRCQEGFTVAENHTACVYVPTLIPPVAADAESDRPECTDNDDCLVLGYFSRCNVSRGKCECYNPDTKAVIKEHRGNGNNSSSRGNKCYSNKYMGQTCKFHKQCSVVTENAVCYKGMCECNETSVANKEGRKCLLIIETLESPCDEDVQCTRSPLGPLSSCNLGTKRCECTQYFPVVYHEPRCYLKRELGASCESNFECQEDSESFAECLRGRCSCGGNSSISKNHTCIVVEPLKILSLSAGVNQNFNFQLFIWMWVVAISLQFLGAT